MSRAVFEYVSRKKKRKESATRERVKGDNRALIPKLISQLIYGNYIIRLVSDRVVPGILCAGHQARFDLYVNVRIIMGVYPIWRAYRRDINMYIKSIKVT